LLAVIRNNLKTPSGLIDYRKKILVTGAGGFVGQVLCRRLAASGFAVTGLFRDTPPSAVWMEVRVAGDLTAVADFAPLVEGADAVVHLAARVHMMRDTATDPEAAFEEVNANVTRKLAKAAAAGGIGRFVFLSSVKANGESTSNRAAFSEIDPPAPEDAYGRSKLAAETALAEIAATTGLPVTTLRVPLVYGPGVRANFASLMAICDTVFPLPLTGITANRRSLLYLGNLTHAIERVIETGGDLSGVYLLSDGEDLSTAELVFRLRRCFDRPQFGIPVPVAVLTGLAALAGRRAAADRLCGSLQVNPSLFGRTFDWAPPFTVDQGFAATAAWRRAVS
jgi:nucleoside-diphosphate-sugar epimerase